MELTRLTPGDECRRILEAVGQKKPCRNALPARALDPMWDPHMPPCISANSSSPSSRGMHFNFTPFGLFLYRASSTNWYMVELATGYFLCFFLLFRKFPCLEEP